MFEHLLLIMNLRGLGSLAIAAAVVATSITALRTRTQPQSREAMIATAYPDAPFGSGDFPSGTVSLKDSDGPLLVPDPYLRWASRFPFADGVFDTALSNLLAAHVELRKAEEEWLKTGTGADRSRVVEARKDVARAENALEGPRRDRDERYGLLVDQPGYRGALIQENTVVLRFRDSVSFTQIQNFLEEQQLEVRSRIASIGLFVVESHEVVVEPGAPVAERPVESKALRVRALVDLLNANDLIDTAVQNSLIGLHRLPESPTTATQPEQRDWFSGRDGVAVSGFPHAWNLNDAIATRVADRGKRVTVGVLDLGFRKTCASKPCDLPVKQVCTTFSDEHGTKMASIIGATYRDRIGMDGAAPFADIASCGVGLPPPCDPRVVKCTKLSEYQSLFDLFLSGLELLIETGTGKVGAQVVNASIGYNWSTASIPTTDPDVQKLVEKQGRKVAALMGTSTAMLVASAGNDSNRASGINETAKWASPFNWAAIDGGAANIVVVESLTDDGTNAKNDSNKDGSIAAVGENIFSMLRVGEYATSNGTSPAAALVTSAIATLLANDDTLTVKKIRTALGVGSGPPKLQVFPAVVATMPDAKIELANIAMPQDKIVNDYDFAVFKAGYDQIVSGKFTTDLNGDDSIDANDGMFCRIDFDGSGKVDSCDLEVMIEAWSTQLSNNEKDELRKRLDPQRPCHP